jgi:flap endonuclease-1
MGIHGLTKLISDNAPGAIKEGVIDNYFGRKIAIDASMSIYQFLIAVRQIGEGQLTNEAGEVTSHLTGMLYRTIRMLEAGMKPVFVFDGKAPTMKSGELAKRKERQKAAEAELTKLQEEGGSAEDIERQQKRTVRASREQSEEVKQLLTLMGVPVIDAPCEAEATCAALAAADKVFATGTEDADALTFGTPILVRHLNASESRKLPIVEVNLQRALDGLQLDMAQFVDLCILCGCDYTDSIKGIGPVKALKMIQDHKNIEGVLKNLDKTKYPLPEPFPFEEARALFVRPEVSDPATTELKWTDPNVDGLKKFLVEEKQFGEDRVNRAIERLQKCKGKNSQVRLESFFGAPTMHSSSKKPEPPKGKGKLNGKGKALSGPAGKKQKK